MLVAVGNFQTMLKRSNTIKLVEAIQTGNCQLLKDVCQSDFVDINTELCNGQTPLGMAIRMKQAHVVAALLECGASVCRSTHFAPVNPYLPPGSRTKKSTPLEIALAIGHFEIIEMLFNLTPESSLSMNTIRKLLKLAVRQMDCDLVRAAIKQCHDTVMSPTDLSELLVMAVLQGDVKMVQLLVTCGADVNRESKGIIPLVYAANNDDMVMCSCLLDLGASLNVIPSSSHGKFWTPLHCAVHAHLEKAVSTLIELGSDPSFILRDAVFTHRGQMLLPGGSSLLHLAVLKRNSRIIAVLLAAGVLISSADSEGNTVLHTACIHSSGETYIVQKLLEANRSQRSVAVQQDDLINSQNVLGQTPLMLATMANEVDLVRLLIDAGAKIHTCDFQNKTLLHTAVEVNNEEMMLCLLRAGCNVDGIKPPSYPVTPLHVAVSDNNVTLVDILLEHGSDVSLKTSSDETVLLLAVTAQNQELVSLFLDKGLDVDAPAASGRTALMEAVRRRNTDICRMLVEEAGASINVRDRNGDAALDLSVYAGCEHNTQLLIVNGAELNVRITPLIEMSVSQGCIHTVEFFVEAGARFTIMDLLQLEKEQKMTHTSQLYQRLLLRLTTARSLRDLCRHHIRTALIMAAVGRSIKPRVNRLELPRSLQSYLLYDNVYCT